MCEHDVYFLKVHVADVEYSMHAKQALQVVNAAIYLQAIALTDTQRYTVFVKYTTLNTGLLHPDLSHHFEEKSGGSSLQGRESLC